MFDLKKQILSHEKPNIWNVHVKGNMEKKLEVDFQVFAVAIMEHTKQNIKDISVFTFYASVNYLTEKFKKK